MRKKRIKKTPWLGSNEMPNKRADKPRSIFDKPKTPILGVPKTPLLGKAGEAFSKVIERGVSTLAKKEKFRRTIEPLVDERPKQLINNGGIDGLLLNDIGKDVKKK